MYGRNNGCMDGIMDAWMDKRMHGWINGCMDGIKDAWME